MNLYYKWIVYVMNKLQIIALYYMNQCFKLICPNFCIKYTYKYIVLYNLSSHVHENDHEHIIMLELVSFNNQA